MADLKVEVVKIDRIEEHPNADRMELAFVGGYQICIRIGAYQPGDLAVYIPVDSVLTEELEALIFGPDSKVKLNKHRVRAIKLRGAVSQGMLLPTKYLGSDSATEGDDVTDVLGITKFQPPVKHTPGVMQGKAAPKRHCHPMFSKYTSINHLKKYWDAFTDGENVIITEKIHGTNFRCGWVPFIPRTFWQKVKNIFGLNNSWEFVYGSHNVQLMDGGKRNKDSFAGNVYKRVVIEHELEGKIPKGQLWYGEIFGAGIQKGYEYGFKDGAVNVAFMDIRDPVANEYFDFHRMVEIVEILGEQAVPYVPFEYNGQVICDMLNDPKLTSRIDNKTQPIEGFVIRRDRSEKFYGGRLILKLLSDEYLLNKNNSDWK